ncbi:MAG: hypothetical protein ABIQ02_04760 [Saprospiraceae bacterium]
MNAIILILLSLHSLTGFQTLVVWKGQTPSHPHEWNCSSNWSNNLIPNEFTDVLIIPDETFSDNYPVIITHQEVNSLCILKGGRITINASEINIYDALKSSYSHTQISGDGVIKIIDKSKASPKKSAHRQSQ